MAEYANAYHGLPDPGMAWPLFLALLDRCGRFGARARLQMMDAVRDGIGAAFSDGHEGEAIRSELVDSAYPMKPGWSPVALIPNLAQEGR